MFFTSTYEFTLDAKHRVAIPADVRVQMQREFQLSEEDSVPFYATVAKGCRALSLYTEPDFQRFLTLARTPGQTSPAFVRALQSLSLNSKRVETDRQGRVLLPDALLQKVTLGKQVVVAGFNDHLEIWDKSAWDTYNTTMDDFVDPSELLADLSGGL